MRRERTIPLPGLLALGAGLILSAPAGAAEVLAPAGWTGRWDFTITYRSSETGRVVAVHEVSSDICPSEPLGLALFEGASSCQAAATDTGLSVDCASSLAVGACLLQGTLRLDLGQSGPTLAGSGEWIAEVSGDCPLVDVATAQTIEVSASRRSAEPAGDCTRTSSLAQKLAGHTAVLALAERPFADLGIDRLKIAGDELEVEGAFTLDPDSDGIDPRAEEVRLQVGPFSASIPAGSFGPKAAGRTNPSEFMFHGSAGGARLQFRIAPLAERRFAFRVHAEHAGVRRTAGPLPVALAVGDDTGSVAARARRPRGTHDGSDDDERGGDGRRDE